MADSLHRLSKYLLLWTVICTISAAPSFVLALFQYNSSEHVMAMMASIACFIIVYTLISCTAYAQRLRRRPFVFDTLMIGYGTRIALSVFSIMPVVAVPDVMLGVISLSITEQWGFRDNNASMVFAATIIQGLLWNGVLAIYMLVVYGLQRAFRKQPLGPGLCSSCGYDLRASHDVCPECGTPIGAR